MSPSGVKEAPLEQTDGGFVAGGEGWFILNARDAPWFVIPADHKWFTRAAIADVIAQSLEGLHVAFPKPSPAQLKEIAEGRRRLREKT